MKAAYREILAEIARWDGKEVLSSYLTTEFGERTLERVINLEVDGLVTFVYSVLPAPVKEGWSGQYGWVKLTGKGEAAVRVLL